MTSRQIAAAILANCTQYHLGRISRETWDAEQRRLWDLADAQGVAWRVKRCVFPPSYAVRAQLRAETLEVGR